MASKEKMTKMRCISKDKMPYKTKKRSQRWNDMSLGKQQQVRHDAKAALAAQQQARAAAQQKLADEKKALSDKEAELQRTSRNKFREADAAKLQAHRTTVWANGLVRNELGGNRLSRALALEARLVDTGFVDLQAARRAVAAKDAQDGVSDKSRLSVLPTGLSVWHFDREGRPRAATITHVHYDDNPPYYTISIDDTAGEAPRETERGRLVPM